LSQHYPNQRFGQTSLDGPADLTYYACPQGLNDRRRATVRELVMERRDITIPQRAPVHGAAGIAMPASVDAGNDNRHKQGNARHFRAVVGLLVVATA
jgi:hypothetical protein